MARTTPILLPLVWGTLGFLWLSGCSGGADSAAPILLPFEETEQGGARGAEHFGTAGAPSTSCEPDDVLECFITIEQANGVTSCWRGIQHCEGAQWGECEQP